LASPFNWERTVEKFHWLSEPFADLDLRGRLIETVERLDSGSVSDLTALLAQVRPAATYPARHPGIQ
jgi:2-methylcitrate dehydratase